MYINKTERETETEKETETETERERERETDRARERLGSTHLRGLEAIHTLAVEGLIH
jgi:hypothetical protein